MGRRWAVSGAVEAGGTSHGEEHGDGFAAGEWQGDEIGLVNCSVGLQRHLWR